MASLYERLGGLEPIASVVDSFVARCASDGRINRKFERTDVPRLKKMLVDQVCEATGGACTYTGPGTRARDDGGGGDPRGEGPPPGAVGWAGGGCALPPGGRQQGCGLLAASRGGP